MQIIRHSTSQHCTTWCDHSQHSITWWSDHQIFHQSVLYNIVWPQPKQYHMVVMQIIRHSTSQHCTTWCDHSQDSMWPQPTQYHMVVRSSSIPPINTVPHDVTTANTVPHGMEVRSSSILPINTVPHGGTVPTSKACGKKERGGAYLRVQRWDPSLS